MQARPPGMVKALCRQLCWVVTLAASVAFGQANEYLEPAADAERLLAVIEAQRPSFAPPAGVTGISVPHHLLADDLIARGFWAASATHPKRVVLISPDHFHKVHGAFATTREDLQTVFGTVNSDFEGVEALLAHTDLFEPLDSIDHEHGVMALAPFVEHFFPEAEIVPVLASINADPQDWREAVAVLTPLLGPETLIVQSTDYSHYRPLGEAVLRDQETLAMIAGRDPEGVLPLLQPSHMDSKAAQFIQMSLQRDVYDAQPVVIANSNSADYTGSANNTTSYIVTAWVTNPHTASAFTYPDQQRVFFGGDVLAGRYFLPVLRDRAAWAAITEAVAQATSGAPMIVNLEGVLLEAPVAGLGASEHVMLMEDAAPILTAFRTSGASLANNHANDLGPVGRGESVRVLGDLGVTPIEHGAIADFGGFRLLAINFTRGRLTEGAIAETDDLDWVCGLDAKPPLVAFVHWGVEYTDVPGAAERVAADALAACGVSLIVGAHPHRASNSIVALGGGRSQLVYSLGNFLFDQSEARGSGALLELRVFKQGTIAIRPVPIPNLFELGRRAMQ
ncbi:MAG: AmmeMemoRadiSam system protein B [Devosia sp.]